MPYIKAIFGEMNTDLSPHVLPSGTADAAVNVTIRDGRLAKRAGFKKDSAVATVLRMMQGPDGTLYTRTTAGWFFVWGNRIYFFDATRGIWSSSGDDFVTSKYAGLPMPAGNPTVTVPGAVAGAKWGQYRVQYSYYNSITGEESLISLPQHSWRPIVSLWGGAGSGSITIADVADVSANYHYTHWRIYCTSGGTDGIMDSAFSQESFLEAEVPIGTATYILRVPDMYHGSLSYPRYKNAGGEPPACTIGVYDGCQAVYCLASGKVEFSIPNQPTMVPRRTEYTDTNVAPAWTYNQMVEPLPWRGEIELGLPSPAIAACYGAGRILIFTERQTIEMLRTADSELVPRILDPHRGCLGAQACVGTAESVHVLSNEQWLVITRDSIRDAAKNHWSAPLRGITSNAVVAHFSYDHQIWLADGYDGSAIYIIDDETGHLISQWTPRNIGRIQAMCEFTVAGATPVMKIASSTGMWTYDPAEWHTQYEDNTTAFAAYWQGYFGTERLAYNQQLTGVRLFMGTNTSIAGGSGGVSLRVTGMGLDEAPAFDSRAVIGTGRHDGHLVFDESRLANFFKVRIGSTAAQARSWAIDDLILEYTARRP